MYNKIIVDDWVECLINWLRILQVMICIRFFQLMLIFIIVVGCWLVYQFVDMLYIIEIVYWKI